MSNKKQISEATGSGSSGRMKIPLVLAPQLWEKEYLKPFSETNSKIYTKYTCGVALMEAPFFLVAHFLSKPLGFASDGHSLPYSYGIMLAGLFYFWLGIFYLYKFLVKNTSPPFSLLYRVTISDFLLTFVLPK